MIIEVTKEVAEEIHRLNGVVLELQADNTRLRLALENASTMLYDGKPASMIVMLIHKALEGK